MAVAPDAVNVRKAQGYAVLESAGDRIGLRKTVGYAVLDSSVDVRIRKTVGYVVLHDEAWVDPNVSARRRPVIMALS